jgi:AhpD family alkylhydroperoxidase
LSKALEHEIPETMHGFEKMQRNHSMDGVLEAKTKEMIALGISIVSRCEGCMITHLHHAVNCGATRDEILEVLSVSVMMGGSPALIMSGIALEALDQYEAAKAPAHLFEPTETVDSWGWS